MKMFNIIHVFYLILVLMSCADESNKIDKKPSPMNDSGLNEVEINENFNISILLDLSDRISPEKYPNQSMEYYLRDVAYVKSISEAFDSHLRKKKVRQMNDRIQVFFDPEPQNLYIDNISRDLRFSISRSNISVELLDEMKMAYSKKPIEIYDLAIKDNNYVGSDTWGFFESKVKDYCVKTGFRNVLIILTDGYIYHKDNIRKEGNHTTYITPQDIRKFRLNKEDWSERLLLKEYGFIPATDDLSNLEILVLGIKPDSNNSYEREVLKKYWSDWFSVMKVSRFEIKSTELPSNMDLIIKNFINN